MNKERIKKTLKSSREEIRRLRRRNEILEAKVSTFEIARDLLQANTQRGLTGEGEDVLYNIDNFLRDLEKEEE